MNKRFVTSLEVVTAVHGAVILAVILTPDIKWPFKKKPEMTIPVEFVIEVPYGLEEKKDAGPKFVEIPKPKDDTVSVKPKVNAKPKPDRKPPKPDTVKIQSPKGSKKPVKPMSEEEIKKWLSLGAKMGDHTSIPLDEEMRCFAVIRQTLHDAWDQPSKAEAGDAEVEVTIRLSSGGLISGSSVTGKSGLDVMDRSVEEAVRSVKRIEGLTEDFIVNHPKVTVGFAVTGE